MDAVRVLIAFYSRNANTEALAKAAADGARSEGAEVRLRRVPDLLGPEIMQKSPGWKENSERMMAEYGAPSPADAEWADGIIFGSPTRFGLVSSELKAYVDSLGGLWAQGKLNMKAGSAFTSTSSPHGGNELTSFTMYAPMAHFGMVIVPPGYINPKVFATGAPYGATAVTGPNSDHRPTADDLDVARFQGARVAQVARALKAVTAGSVR